MSPLLRNRILYRIILGDNLTGFRNYAARLMHYIDQKVARKFQISPKFESTLRPHISQNDSNAPSCIEDPDDTTCINFSTTHHSQTLFSQNTDFSEYAHNYTSYMSTIHPGPHDRGIEKYHSGVSIDYQYCGKCRFVCGRAHDSILMVAQSDLEIEESTMGEVAAMDMQAIPPVSMFQGQPVFSQTGKLFKHYEPTFFQLLIFKLDSMRHFWHNLLVKTFWRMTVLHAALFIIYVGVNFYLRRTKEF